MSDIRIFFLVNSLSKGGAERVISILANKFQSKNYKVDLLYFRNIPVQYPINRQVNLKCLNAPIEPNANIIRRFFLLIKRVFILKKALKNIPKNSVIISFGDGVSILLMISKLISFSRIKTIISIRSNPLKNTPFIYRNIASFFYIFSSKIVVQSKFIERSISNSMLRKKIVTIFNPVPNNFTVNPYNIKPKKYSILSIGRYIRSKRHDILINAFSNVIKDKNKHLTLCIAGKDDGEKRHLDKLIKELKIENNVILLDAVDDVYSLYLNSDIYVHPSEYEGMSNAVLEAMSSGLPSIISNYDGIEEIINDNENGYLFETNNISALTNTINNLLIDNEKKLDFSDKCYQQIKKDFDINLIFRRWESIILNLFK